MAGEMKYRLPVSELTDSHMLRYIEAIGASKRINDNRGFFHYAGIHGSPGRWCWHHQFSQRSNLTARMFLPWHRAYLHRLEQSLQDLESDVAIPWWDWTGEEAIPTAFSRSHINGEENPLFDSLVSINPPQVPTPVNFRTTRNPGNELPVFSFPRADINRDGRATLEELVNFLVDEVTTFESFNDLLESVHDQLHVYVGGSMGNTTYAAYDPIFYSHHCMIDRVWALWQQKHGIENFPVALRTVVLEPFGLTAGEVLNFQTLGYEYANAVHEIPFSDIDGGGQS